METPEKGSVYEWRKPRSRWIVLNTTADGYIKLRRQDSEHGRLTVVLSEFYEQFKLVDETEMVK